MRRVTGGRLPQSSDAKGRARPSPRNAYQSVVDGIHQSRDLSAWTAGRGASCQAVLFYHIRRMLKGMITVKKSLLIGLVGFIGVSIGFALVVGVPIYLIDPQHGFLSTVTAFAECGAILGGGLLMPPIFEILLSMESDKAGHYGLMFYYVALVLAFLFYKMWYLSTWQLVISAVISGLVTYIAYRESCR